MDILKYIYILFIDTFHYDNDSRIIVDNNSILSINEIKEIISFMCNNYHDKYKIFHDNNSLHILDENNIVTCHIHKYNNIYNVSIYCNNMNEPNEFLSLSDVFDHLKYFNLIWFNNYLVFLYPTSEII